MNLKKRVNLIILLFVTLSFSFIEFIIYKEFSHISEVLIHNASQQINDGINLSFQFSEILDRPVQSRGEFKDNEKLEKLREILFKKYSNITSIQIYDLRGRIIIPHNERTSEKIKILSEKSREKNKIQSTDLYGSGGIKIEPFKSESRDKDYVLSGIIFSQKGIPVYKFDSIVNFSELLDPHLGTRRMLFYSIFIVFLITAAFIYYYLNSSIFNRIEEIEDRLSVYSKDESIDRKCKFDSILPVFEKLEAQIRNLDSENAIKSLEIDKLNKIINDTHKEAEQLQRLASIGTITSGITHEIGNPLGAISAYVNSLKDPSFAENRKVEIYSEISEEIKRIEHILKKVLHFSKFREESEEIVDLTNLIDESLELCSYHKNFKKVELVKDLDSEPQFLKVRKNLLLQVFINIITNALDEMPKGGELIFEYEYIKGIPHQLANQFPEQIVMAESDEFIDIKIIDTGKGIDDHDLAKVFSAFYTEGKKKKGTGLGLHISYKIMRSMGGVIFAERNDKGKGSIIHVQIPHKNEGNKE